MAPSHVITITHTIEIMKNQMNESPKLLHESAGKDSCCIFRVPQIFAEVNKESYSLLIVSIGPYHHGKKDLEMIQEHKWRFLDNLIKRTGKPLDQFMSIMVSMEKEIRESYSESIDLDTNDLAKMMVLDGSFLIELFLKAGRLVPSDPDDPIFKMLWVSTAFRGDLLRLENQIPFVVLKALYKESKPNTPRTLQSLIFEFFGYYVADWQPKVMKQCENHEAKHLLDLFRETFIQANTKNKKPFVSKAIGLTTNSSLKLIKPATKLTVAGVKFKANHQAGRLLDIEFQNGLLLVPPTIIDAFYGSFFMNCIAFEQCYYHCSNDITTYSVFMGCLMNTSMDVSLLSQNKIIENYFGTDKELAKFFNDIRRHVEFDNKSNHLLDLSMEVNGYRKHRWHVGWAELKHTYFESPWATASTFAACMLISLTALQTAYTILSYYHDK